MREVISTSVAARHHFVPAGRYVLHVMEFGRAQEDAPPVLLLHGVGGSSWIWHDVVEALPHRAHVLAMDLRGYGGSDRSATHDYATVDHAADLADVLAALEVPRVDVVGFSWGGLVAIRAASMTDAIRRLVIVDIPPSSERTQEDLIPFQMEYPDVEAAVGAQRNLAARARGETLERVARLTTHPIPGGRTRDHDRYFSQRWPFLDEDLWEELESLTQPLLLVHAAESPVLSAAVAEDMMRRADDAELTVIPDSGHLVPLEQPAVLARAIDRFTGR